jgi:membrane fusion protein (multidrug efflux system)
MRLKTLLVLAVLAAGGGGAWYWFHAQPVEVRTVEVKTGTAAELVYASGVVEPKTWAKVASLVRERIVEVCDCEGETVAAGKLLVRLDDSEVRANARQLEARRVLARRELERASDLLNRNVGSQQTFERAGAELAEIEASLAAQVEKQNDHLITAPMSGQVLRLDASVGEIADPGEALAWVGLPRPLEVVAEVNEEDIPRVRTGQRVLLRSDAFRDRSLAGTVGLITPKGDPVGKTYRVRIDLPDDTPLFIGMSVDANIVIREMPDRVIVPVAALSGNRVHVVSNGVLALKSLELGIRGLESAEVVSGLAAGDRIVMPLPEGVEAGDRVVEAAPAEAAP